MATEYPNWVNLDVIKGPMYLNQKDTDAARDNALVLLGQMVTAEIISYLDNPDIDITNPPFSLVRAALKQTCFEWNQRRTPGLQSVQMQDGSISKYQIDEWLKDVEQILKRHLRYALFETSITELTYEDKEPEYDPNAPSGSVPPSAPVFSSATPAAASVVCAWSPVSDATSYNLYYHTGTTVNKNTATKITGVTSAKTVTGLTTATQYAFAITAVNDNGESSLSIIKTATPS